MIPILLGLGSAVANATENVIIRNTKEKLDSSIVTLYKFLFAAIFVLPLLAYNGINITDDKFWIILIVSSFVFVFGTIWYVKAIHLSGIAHTIPFFSFTPMFALFTGSFFLGESITKEAFIGVFLIISGAYVLNIQKYKEGFFEPFLFILKEKGSLIMFLLSIMFSFAGILYKAGINASDPITMLGMELIVSSVLITSFVLMSKHDNSAVIKLGKKHYKEFILFGIVIILGDISLGYSMKYLFAAYALALKRTTVLFSIILGYLFFSEKEISDKIVGSLIMLAGVAVISYFS